MKSLLALLLTSLALVACSTPIHQATTEASLDARASYCQNSSCMYDIALQYMRLGATTKGWTYMDLSARDGFPNARTALINAGRKVPPKDANANW